MITEVQMFDLVIFDDGVDSNPKSAALEDTFSLADSFRHNYLFYSLNDTVIFHETLKTGGENIYSQTLADAIIFTETTHWRAHIEGLSDFLYLKDYLELPGNGTMNDSFTFTDSMDGDAGAGLIDTLTLQDSWSYLLFAKPVITDTLTFSEGITTYMNGNPWRPMVPIVPEAL